MLPQFSEIRSCLEEKVHNVNSRSRLRLSYFCERRAEKGNWPWKEDIFFFKTKLSVRVHRKGAKETYLEYDIAPYLQGSVISHSFFCSMARLVVKSLFHRSQM